MAVVMSVTMSMIMAMAGSINAAITFFSKSRVFFYTWIFDFIMFSSIPAFL